MFGTNETLPHHSTHFIFSLKEAWYFLHEIVRVYDPDPEFTYWVLENLVADIMAGEQHRDPVGSHFDNAKSAMLDMGMSVNDTARAASETGELIIDAVCSVVPDFGSKVYVNAYQYLLRRPYDVYLSVAYSAFADVSAPSTRPYRL